MCPADHLFILVPTVVCLPELSVALAAVTANTAFSACAFALKRRTLGEPSPSTRTPAGSRTLSTTTPQRSPSSSGGPFSFHVSASFIGKDRRYDPSTHVFHFNPYNRIQQTRRNKRSRPDSGHDAFFVSRVGDTGSVALGVADGVGGWVESGVDPADFSHGLCENMASVAYQHDSSSSSASPPPARGILQAGYQAVCEDRSIRAGGSTACVAVASPAGTVDVANLGDSGFLQLRLGAVQSHSEPQTHAFNTPFQLSIVPPSVAARMAAFGGAQLSDFPRDADVYGQEVRHGDVLIFASDGVWDNLFNQDILRVATRVMAASGAWVRSPDESEKQGGVTHHNSSIRVVDDLRNLTAQPENGSKQQQARAPSSPTLQSALAAEITGAAKAASVNTKVDGPFAKDVQKWFPHENWRGGKVDDIVVVAVVVSDDSRAERPKSKL